MTSVPLTSKMLSRLVPCLIAFACSRGAVAAEQIDPAIYSRLFMNNRPMFDRMSAVLRGNLREKDAMVLDLASGPGEPTVTLASQDPTLQIVCTDFQKDMNEKAIARASKAGVDKNVSFAVTSADDLSSWQDNTFHAVTMSFGLMFVPDKAKSLREIYRVLKPGGYAYIAVWKKLTFYSFAQEVMAQVTQKDPPEFALNPMKLKDVNVVEDLSRAASLEIFADETVTYGFTMGSPQETADGLTILAGSTLKQIVENGDKDATARFYDIVNSEIERRGWKSGDAVTIPENSAQLLTIRKPIAKQEL